MLKTIKTPFLRYDAQTYETRGLLIYQAKCKKMAQSLVFGR